MMTIAGVTQGCSTGEAAQPRRRAEAADSRPSKRGRLRQPTRDSETAELVHDFRNILNTVGMLSELALIDLPEGSAVSGTVQTIKAACADANDLCNRMLEHRAAGFDGVECVDLATLVRTMAPQLAAALPSGATLRLDLSESAPLVDASPRALRRVVMNLVKNAAEALGDAPGEVAVAAGFVESVAGEARSSHPGGTQRCCSVTVTDTGCGMDDATRTRLLESSFTTKADGYGLGMASIRRIVHDLGGTIEIQSEVGCGTQVRILLPRVQPDDNSAVDSHASGLLVDRTIRTQFDERRHNPRPAGRVDRESVQRIGQC